MDIFDRIAAAVLVIQSGAMRNTDYEAHLAAIDQHLQDTDAHEASTSADEDERITSIEQGLTKLADTLASATAPATTGLTTHTGTDDAPATTDVVQDSPGAQTDPNPATDNTVQQGADVAQEA